MNDRTSVQDYLTDVRRILEMGEARTLVASFKNNGSSVEWVDRALKISERFYGKGSALRIREYMRQIYRESNHGQSTTR